MSRKFLPLGPLMAALAACGDGAPAEQDFYVEPEMPDNPTALTDRAADEVADRDALPSSSVMTGVGALQAGGTVSVSTDPDGITLVVEVSGLPEPGEYPAHIHRGVCAEGGPVAAALDNLAIGSGGSGASVTVLSSGSVSTNEPLFVQVHTPTGTPVVCGDLVGSG